MIEPRYYQTEAKQELYKYWNSKPSSSALLSLATGTGKSVIIADITKDIIQKRDNTRVLILSHVSEILSQNANKICQVWPDAPIGIYSASLGQKKHRNRIVVAGIQSVHKKANVMGWFSLVIIDEAHLVSDKDAGMYRTFIKELRKINTKLRILGLSATPWRTKGGLLTHGEEPLFDDIVYTYSMRQAIDDGYLCPIIGRPSLIQADLSNVSTRMGEFNLTEMAGAFDNEYLTQMALNEIIQLGSNRKAWLLFGSSVDHAIHLRDTLIQKGIPSACITGETSTLEREGILRLFKDSEKFRAVTNNNVLTTGTDIPRIDLIGFLRATKSSGLFLQAVGRGVRLHQSKENCLLLDYGGNLDRFGCIDQIEAPTQRKKGESVMPTKLCPDPCRTMVAISTLECPNCGYVFPIDTTYKHDIKATNAPAMTIEQAEWFDIDTVEYHEHPGRITNKQMPDGSVVADMKPNTLRVTYLSGAKVIREWVCINHTGYAKNKANKWLEDRIVFDANIPYHSQLAHINNEITIKNILDGNYELLEPKKVKVRRNGKYEEVVGYEF